MTDADAERWDAFIAAHPLGKAMATTRGLKAWQASGWSQHLLGAFEGQEVVAGAVACTKKLPHLPWTVARITTFASGGQDRAATASALLAAVRALARRLRAAEIESRCLIPEGVVLNGIPFHADVREELLQAGYAETNSRQGTYMVRIDVDDESLMQSFRSKCRRDARKGLREGVTNEPLDAREDFGFFCESHREMCRRKGLPPVSEAVYEGMRPMVEAGHLRLFGARYDGHVQNMALVDALGIPRYTLGVATPGAYEKGVPPTGQALHFGIMQWCRDHGKAFYDLGGSPGPEPQPGDPNFSVWQFKYEFGGDYVYMIPYYRRSLGVFGGALMRLARRLGKLG